MNHRNTIAVRVTDAQLAAVDALAYELSAPGALVSRSEAARRLLVAALEGRAVDAAAPGGSGRASLAVVHADAIARVDAGGDVGAEIDDAYRRLGLRP